jgi:hypothetical protein
MWVAAPAMNDGNELTLQVENSMVDARVLFLTNGAPFFGMLSGGNHAVVHSSTDSP